MFPLMKSALALAMVAALLAVSCKYAPPPLADDAPSAIYFQRAQAAADDNDFDKAMGIYQKFLDNQPNASHEDTFSARYEIALLKKKKGKFAESEADFQSILADLGDLDKSSGAPGWIKLLTQKMLQDVKDKVPKPKA